jgi:regulatory protein
MELNREQTEAFHRAAALCSRAEKCSNDMLVKLSQWGVNEDDAELILDRLIEEKYIDDERFARSFVRDKFRFNKWGKTKIAYQLRGNRINSTTVNAAMEEIDGDDYWEALLDLVKEKNKSIKAANQYDRKGKLVRFAQSRGFEMDLIYMALDEILK